MIREKLGGDLGWFSGFGYREEVGGCEIGLVCK